MGLRYNPQTGEFEDDGSGDDDLGWLSLSGNDPLDVQNLPELLPQANYSNEGRNYPTSESTQGPGGSPANASVAWQNQPWAKGLPDWAKSALGLASSKAGFTGLMALLSYLDRQKGTTYGGGVAKAYAGPSKPLTRTMVQGKYGPIATYAAQGGLMQAYANGGAVQPFPMQDGGFVMTGDAVSGAGGQSGLKQLIPEAQAILGPGTKTSDSIPAYIDGPNGTTPAKVSNGEAYIPPGRDTQGLYALMQRLERNA